MPCIRPCLCTQREFAKYYIGFNRQESIHPYEFLTCLPQGRWPAHTPPRLPSCIHELHASQNIWKNIEEKRAMRQFHTRHSSLLHMGELVTHYSGIPNAKSVPNMHLFNPHHNVFYLIAMSLVETR